MPRLPARRHAPLRDQVVTMPDRSPAPDSATPLDPPVPSGPGDRPLTDVATLRRLVPRLREGLYVTDADGAFLDANPAMLALLGMGSMQELLTYSLQDLVADPEGRRTILAGLASDGDMAESELELRRPDGQPCIVVDSVARQTDPVTGAVAYHGILLDVTGRVGLERQLHESGVRDALTGCYNRRYLMELERRFVDEDVATWGFVFLDVKGFREINELHGRERGDEVLTRMTRFLFRQVRAEESVVRVGADDFLIVLAGADEGRTEHVARRLQLAAMRHAPASFSIGWASRRPGESFKDTMSRAEQQLLDATVISRQVEHNRRGH